jgi:ATP-dependent DNA helicase RecG
LNAREPQRLIAAGETLLVQFKGEARAPLSDDDVVEAVICLANRASS